MKSLRVATCQFSVEPDIAHNRRAALRHIAHAADQGADVVHFSECALSGYAGVEFESIDALDWEQLEAATRDVMAAAKEHKHPMALAEIYTASYFEDMDELNCLRPDISPRASGHIIEQIELVKKLLEKDEFSACMPLANGSVVLR